MFGSRKPLVELLRPQQLSDITLPARDIDRLQQMIDTRNIMNMVFYGRPGLGKTSAAKLIGKQSGLDWVFYQRHELKGSDWVETRIMSFATSVSFTGGLKLCILDEAENYSPQAYTSLRGIIESASCVCRFILTVNELGKLGEPMRSRLQPVCFDIAPVYRPAVLARWLPRYQAQLTELGVCWEEQKLAEIAGTYFPDLRRIGNQVEYEFKSEGQ